MLRQFILVEVRLRRYRLDFGIEEELVLPTASPCLCVAGHTRLLHATKSGHLAHSFALRATRHIRSRLETHPSPALGAICVKNLIIEDTWRDLQVDIVGINLGAARSKFLSLIQGCTPPALPTVRCIFASFSGHDTIF